VGFKCRGDDFAIFDRFAVPTLSAKGVDDGVKLSGACHAWEDGRGRREWEGICVAMRLF